METNRLTFLREVAPSQLPHDVFDDYMAWIDLGGIDPQAAAAARASVWRDPDANWEPEHGVFFLGSDGLTYAAYDDYAYDTQFAVHDGTSWDQVLVAGWVRLARAFVKLRRAQR